MKTHTLVFNEVFNNTEFSLVTEYTLFSEKFGCFLAFNEEPKEYPKKFTKKDNIYIYKTGDIDTNKYKSSIKFNKKRITKEKTLSSVNVNYQDLIKSIKKLNSNFVVYTGAGISKEAGIMDSFELKSSLYLNNLPLLINTIVNNANHLKEVYKRFVNSLYFTEPTRGHQIIKSLQDNYSFMLLTENIDILHQKTKAKVYPYNKITKELLQDKKIMLAMGLDADHQGAINFMQKHNATIICVNINKPNYLTEKDIWVKEDIHSFLTQLYNQSIAYNA